jgi:hypothetical protein
MSVQKIAAPTACHQRRAFARWRARLLPSRCLSNSERLGGSLALQAGTIAPASHYGGGGRRPSLCALSAPFVQ